MPGEENALETSEPTTSGAGEQANSQKEHQQQQKEKRGEDGDRYAASVAEVAAGGGGSKKGEPAAAITAPPASQAPPAPGPLAPPQQQLPPPHHNVPPNSFAPPPGTHHPGMAPPMEWRGAEQHQLPPGYPPGYPPYGMPPRHHSSYPPPHPYGYPPSGAYGYAPPHIMRPPVMPPGEMVRMPPGPTPTEWAAQQAAVARGIPLPGAPGTNPAKEGPNGNPTTPSSVSQPIPSPSASSIAEESLDGKPSGTKMPAEQQPQPPPSQHHQQMMSPIPPHTPGGPSSQQTSSSAVMPTTPADVPKGSGKVLSKTELLEKLVGPVTLHNPLHVMHERRVFFDRLIEFCERNGDPITMVPQVSKQSIDLHRLYIGVRGKGGFQAVTKEKYWKNLCTEANPDLAESSAAGYQLRKHYQRHLLMLECMETGRNPEDEVAFADKMKRQRKREPASGSGAAAAAAVAAAAAASQSDQKQPIPPGSAAGASGAGGVQPPPGAYTPVSTKGKRTGGGAGGSGGGDASKKSKMSTPRAATPSTSQLPPHLQAQLEAVPPPTQLHQHPDLMRMAQASATWWPMPHSSAERPAHQQGISGTGCGAGSGYLQVPSTSAPQMSPGATPQRSPSGYSGFPPPMVFPLPLPPPQSHISRNEQFYRSRGFYPPGFGYLTGNGQGPSGATSGAPPFSNHPGMDPNYHYYQQHGMMPPHPGYPPHMAAFSPGQYPGHQRIPPPGSLGASLGQPGTVPPGAQAMRAPMPQNMQHHEMDEQQRQWYAQQHAHQQAALAAHHHAQQQHQAAAQAAASQATQANNPVPTAPAAATTPAPAATPSSSQQQPSSSSGANTQPATPSASNQPPTPADATPLHAEGGTEVASQAGSRAPSTGPGPSATPDSTSRMSGGADGQTAAASETPTPTGEAGSTTPVAASANTPAPTDSVNTPSTSAATPGPPQQQAPPPPQPYPGFPGYPPPGAMRPPTGFAPAPGTPYGYPPGAPPPAAYHPSHPQHPQHAQYLAWQQQRYHQQQVAVAATQQPGGPPPPGQGSQRPSYPGYPGGAVTSGPPQRMPPPPPQGAPSPSGVSTTGKQARYGTPGAQPPQARVGAPTPQPLAANLPVPSQPSTPSQPQTVQAPGGYLASTLATPGAPLPATSSALQQQQSIIVGQHQYPAGSVEAVTAAQTHVKRRKVYARELINATPRRLVMALRCGLDAEAIWAVNALNVLLYDDTNPQPSLQQMPGLLNVIVEHLYATLSILFPTDFPLSEPGKPFFMEESDELVNRLIENVGAEQNGGVRTFVEKMPVVPRKGSDKTATFTMQSRNGLLVHFREECIPAALRKRITRENTEKDLTTLMDQSIRSKYVGERNAVGLGGGIAERLATRLRDKILHEKTRPAPVFSKYMADDDVENEQIVDNDNEIQVKQEPLELDENRKQGELLIRGARPDELSDCKHEMELAWPRPTALSPKSQAMEDLAHRSLALSNILRGFSFVPGSDLMMARNEALLYIVGRFLKLNVSEKKICSKRPGVISDTDDNRREPFVQEKRVNERAVLDDIDATTSQMVETAGQLRDDAFVMLTHMSVSLNLFDLPDTIAYPIYDGLLTWAVSRVPEATDATAPIPVSPRDYSLEIMCKMVVIERNVDMFLSTGSWSRVEQLVHILSRLLTMNEETHYREFAIVILNALCIASEAVCYICAMETSSIAHLILFIDSADQNMHQVMQTHGMNALRDNPELMGTSVGMLRRAASMLRLLIKVPKAYRIFMKHQTRLLQFTMSQLMDSRVAGMVADTLYEIQEYVKEFGEEVPEPLKITYSEGYRLEEEEEVQNTPVSVDEKETESRPSSSPKDNGSVNTTTADDVGDEVAAVATIAENEEEKKEVADEGESCDGYETESLQIAQKRAATALIDEQSQSPPPAKRSCLTNGFDKSKSSVSTNGTLSEASQNDGALTTAVA